MADNDKLSQNGREESETEEKIIREMEAQKTENSAEEASVFSDLLHSMGLTKKCYKKNWKIMKGNWNNRLNLQRKLI